MFKKLFWAVISILLFFSTGISQNNSVGLNLMLGAPQGEFNNHVDIMGGLSLQYLYTPENRMPFSLGINVGYLNYGNETKREKFSSYSSSLLLDVDRTNNIVNFHILGQFGPSKGLIRPYLEALIGGAYLFTRTEISDRYDFDEDDIISSENNYDDFAWNYGGGGGVGIYLTRFEGDDNSGSEIVDLFLDLKVRYIYGTKARYMNKNSIRLNNGTFVYDVHESNTDILSINLGVTVCF